MGHKQLQPPRPRLHPREGRRRRGQGRTAAGRAGTAGVRWGGVIYAMTLRGLSNEINVRYERAPSGSMPAIYDPDGGDGPQLVMYRTSDKTAYSLTEQGEDVRSAYKHSIILCERGIVSYEHDFLGRSGPLSKVKLTPYNQE